MTVQEKIKQRRRQMLVHSYLYYEKDVSIISDYQWSQWAMELVQLQTDYPKESAEVEFADLFSDWNGSSGAHLQYSDSIKHIAEHLYSIKDKKLAKVVAHEVKKVPKRKVKSNTKSLF